MSPDKDRSGVGAVKPIVRRSPVQLAIDFVEVETHTRQRLAEWVGDRASDCHQCREENAGKCTMGCAEDSSGARS